MKRIKQRLKLAIAIGIGLLLFMTGAQAANPTPTAGPAVIKYTPNMSVASLASRPGTDVVQFSSGRRMTVGELRKLDRMLQEARAPKIDKMPRALKVKPNANNIKVRMTSAADLSQVLKRPDNDTIQLHSGRLATVGQIKLVQPLLAQRLGRPIASLSKRSDLSGPAIKVTKSMTKAQWEEIGRKPDNTILENPNGVRITVGELKSNITMMYERGKDGKGSPAQRKLTPMNPSRPKGKGGLQ
jgi:hypothetical protein